MALPIPVEKRNEIIAAALAEIAQGAGLREIAKKQRIAHSTLCTWLLRGDLPDVYKALQREGLLQRVVDADEELREAKSHLEVQRATQTARFARWDLERRIPEWFSVRTEITGAGGAPIELSSFERAQRFAFLQRQAADPPPCIEGAATLVSETPADPAPAKPALVGGPPMRNTFRA